LILRYFQDFKGQFHPHIIEVQQMNQELSAMKETSSMAAEALLRPVENLNKKWDNIIRDITAREVRLNYIFSSVSKYTVKPVYSGHLADQVKVVIIDRWHLWRGHCMSYDVPFGT